MTKGETDFVVEHSVIEQMVSWISEKPYQMLTLFNQKDAPVSTRQRERDQERMQIDEGANPHKEFLDLSLSKRKVMKTKEDFEREH